MASVVNMLRGTVKIAATGPFPERLLNLCAQQGVSFWGVKWLDEQTIYLTSHRQTLEKLRELAQRVGCEIRLEGSRGLPSFLARFRSRYGFLLGLALSLLAVCVLSSFVFTIEVSGNERVPTAEILTELRRLGVRPGVYGPGLERKELAQVALLELEDLSWMTINIYGTRLEVIVREVTATPKLNDESGFYNIVAKVDGMITHLEASQGDRAVAEGDTVQEGDVLISGTVTMEPPKYSDLPVRYYQTHARGKVWARTWRTLTAEIPVTAQVKEYTGQDKTLWSLTLFGRKLEFYQNSSISWAFYDKISTVYQPDLPKVGKLPLQLTAERCQAYEPVSVDIDKEAAQTLLEEQLLKRLTALMGEEGEMISTSYSAKVKDEMLQVTLLAECREEIGREEPATQEIPTEEPGEQENE